MKFPSDSLGERCSGSPRDARNQMRVMLWSFIWALSFVAVTLIVKRAWWPFGATLAGALGTSLLGVATLFAYRRFLHETDELRRKIEVEALSLAFGVGLVGGMTYWLLAVMNAVPAKDFCYVFLLMIVAHPVGVLIGRRRYS
jgi:drug/metabolite transporter (DMT)-like permease